jgi:hypothetical protein
MTASARAARALLSELVVQTWFRGPTILGAAACALGCTSTVTYPSVSTDTSTTAGWLADGTSFLSSAGVFGTAADDGSHTVPPLDATFEMKGLAGADYTVEIRASVSTALPSRPPSDVLVCAIARGVDVEERCDKPDVEVQIDFDSSSCAYSPCLVNVAGRLTLTGSAVFNGTVVFDHEEQWTTTTTGDQEIL